MDLICCLNVLDRCSDPFEILAEIHRALSPKGRAVIALVLPYNHYVETSKLNTSLYIDDFIVSHCPCFLLHTDETHLPLKPLLSHWTEAISLPFDQEARCFFEELEGMGFRIEAWTKAPYLCEGDLRQSFYWLVDVVVILSKR